jgi:outer membrane protein OmpA-like peptidoglycan-associated protein
MKNMSTWRKGVVLPSLPAWLAISALVGVGAGGCASRTGTGAVVGGVSGAVIGAGAGAAAGGNKGALIGAGVGAAAGAGAGALVGRYMDRQQEALEKQVKAAEIVRQGDEIAVRFNEAILFDINRSDLKPNAKRDLTELAAVLKQYNETDLVIEGHTDSTGPRSFNDKLSWARAQAVTDYLKAEGVDTDRLSARGLADTKPIASNDSETGRRQNRRVQVQIAANEELKRKSAAAETGATTTTATAPAKMKTR